MENIIRHNMNYKIINKESLGTFYVVLSAILFSLGGIFIKLMPWGSMSINGVRSLLAFIVYFIYLKLTKHKIIFNKTVLFGAVCNMLTGYTFVLANQLTSAANAIVLQFTQPIFVILFLWLFFHNKPSKNAVITCLVAFSGMTCFFFDKLTYEGILGNFIAVLSGICYAFVFLLKKMPEADTDSSLMYSCLLGAIVGLPFLPNETDFSAPVLLYVFILGVFQFGLALVFLARGLRTVQPFTASISSMIEPILNPILVAVFYGESIGVISMIGAVFVIGASAFYSISSSR